MALQNCPECNKEVSTEAESCPHCGYVLLQQIIESHQPTVKTPKSFFRKPISYLWLLLAFPVLFFVIYFVFLTGGKPINAISTEFITKPKFNEFVDPYNEALHSWQNDKSNKGKAEVLLKRTLEFKEFVLKNNDSLDNSGNTLDSLIRVEANMKSLKIKSLVAYANDSWKKTGVIVGDGDNLIIEAKGQWKCGDGEKWTLTGPEGYLEAPDTWRDYRISTLIKLGALIWKIDGGDKVGDCGQYKAPSSGEILIRINDDDYANNSGTMEVTIVTFKD